MRISRLAYVASFGSALTGLCGTSIATITPYSSRAAFETAAGTFIVEDFETFTPTNNAFYGTSFDFGDFSAENDTNSLGLGGDIAGAGSVNGSTEIAGVVFVSGAQFRLTFLAPITALGFEAVNLADQRFDDLVFNNASNDVVPIHDPIDQTRFWGFISDTPFTTLTIRQTGFGAGGGPNDGFRFDNVTYTPAPGAALPLAVLLLGRRVRRAN